MPLIRRYHLLEINDQSWWPPILAEKVQNALSMAWIHRVPILQPTSPAALIGKVLTGVLQHRIGDYVYVDFCSGAGGPTPYLERHLNTSLREKGQNPVDFVLTDIKPNIPAWSAAAKKSDHLTFIPRSVDATSAPEADALLKNISGGWSDGDQRKIMRLFSLSFHHFDDDLAMKVLQNTVETSDGFCIIEVIGRDISSIILCSLTWLMLMLQTPLYFLRDFYQMFFTYLVPLVPWVVVFDGYISTLRIRTPDEVEALLKKSVPKEALAGWKFQSGSVQHTWPLGYFHWVICYKED